MGGESTMMQVYRQGRLTGFKANNGKIYSIKKYGMKGAISKASKAELIRPMTYNQILKQRLPKASTATTTRSWAKRPSNTSACTWTSDAQAALS